MIRSLQTHSSPPSLRTLIVTLSVALSLGACEQGTDAPDVRAAYDRLTAGLAKADPDALWALTDSATQVALLEVADRVLAAGPIIEAIWGDPRGADGSRALDAIAYEAFERGGALDEGRGPRLVEAFLNFQALTWTEGSREALEHPTIIMDDASPARAIVRVPSGESFIFEKDGDAWKSTLVRMGTLESPRFKGILANLDKVSAYSIEVERSWRVSLDARTPQGAYNLMRRAQTDPDFDPKALFPMLDDETRGLFRQGLELGRKLQRRIQQRTVKAQRQAAYEASGIQLAVNAKTDAELFAAWYKQHSNDFDIPKDAPRTFERDVTAGSDSPRGHILTESGKTWPLLQREDGFWATTIFLTAVQTKLIAPLKAAEAEVEVNK